MKRELPRTASILLVESFEARCLIGVEATHGGEADATSLGLVLPCLALLSSLFSLPIPGIDGAGPGIDEQGELRA
jgi:hypothetical protein